jgi:SAM-dependent methyltransferase
MERKLAFNEVVDEYANHRPGYPEEMFDDVIRITGLNPKSRLCEVGCGTGQATEPFLRRGLSVHAVEIGDQMCVYVHDKFRDYPGFQVTNLPFEAFPEETPFDFVYSASAFHWVAPDTGLAKVNKLLRPGGWFMQCWNQSSEAERDTPVFDAIRDVYTNLGIERGTAKELVANCVTLMEQSDYFEPMQRFEYPYRIHYNADNYLRLIGTYSDHIRMEPELRNRLYAGIRQAIETVGNGEVVTPFRVKAYLARKRG